MVVKVPRSYTLTQALERVCGLKELGLDASLNLKSRLWYVFKMTYRNDLFHPLYGFLRCRIVPFLFLLCSLKVLSATDICVFLSNKPISILLINLFRLKEDPDVDWRLLPLDFSLEEVIETSDLALLVETQADEQVLLIGSKILRF